MTKRDSYWPEVRKALETRIANHQATLEGPLDIDETNRLRGRIAELREIIASAEGADVEPARPAHY